MQGVTSEATSGTARATHRRVNWCLVHSWAGTTGQRCCNSTSGHRRYLGKLGDWKRHCWSGIQSQSFNAARGGTEQLLWCRLALQTLRQAAATTPYYNPLTCGINHFFASRMGVRAQPLLQNVLQ